jgi:O-antigen/teichoic acid export membrane protein
MESLPVASKDDVISGIKWTSVSTFGRRILALLANIVLARLLAPADFGLVAMAAVVLGFIDIFKDLGTGAALIQRKQVSEELLSSIFWFNVGFGLFATTAAILCAPLIAVFYKEPRVTPILIGMSVSFLLSALTIVHNCLLQRQLAFVTLAKVEVASAVVSYVVGIGAALLGYGVWSLVYQVVTNSAVFLVLIWFASDWRPRLVFLRSEIKSVMSYSLNLAAFNVFYYFSQNVDNFLIGRYLGSEALGYYDLAYRLMTFPMQAISAVFGKVMLPYYARAQDDLARFRQGFMRSATAIAFVTFPMMLGLLAVREHFVLALFGPKWVPVITLLALFAPLAALRSITTTTGSIFLAMGRTDLQLRWGVFSNLFVISGLVIGLQWGMIGVATGFTIATLLLLYHSFAIPFRLIDMRVAELAGGLKTTALCSMLMFAAIEACDLAIPAALPPGLLLAIEIAIGAVAYIVLTWLLNRPLLDNFLHTAGLRKAPVPL